MIETNSDRNDTPEGWHQYAGLLRSQPGPALSQERSAEILSGVHTAIAAGSRTKGGRGWASRWVLIPAASAVAVIIVMFLVNISGTKQSPAPKSTAPAVVKESQAPPRQTRRPSRNRLPAPSVPENPPTVIDSSLLPKAGPVPPLVDPVGPGGSRTPRNGGYRPGP